MKCIYCNEGNCTKKGTRNNVQRYRCKSCGKLQQAAYSKPRHYTKNDRQIVTLLIESCGIRSIGRIVKIAPATVCRRILSIAAALQIPLITASGRVYEIDELRTFIKHKQQECWVIYAIDRESRTPVSLMVGRRNKENVGRVVESVMKLSPSKVCTDGLEIYRYLIPQPIHHRQAYKINHIERHNLTLRTHLKRLSRRTLCFSKSAAMLAACLCIYFWG